MYSQIGCFIVALSLGQGIASAQLCDIMADQPLPVPALESNDNFGSAAAVSGDVMGVVSEWDGTNVSRNGAVFMYRRGPSGWEVEDTIDVPDNQLNTNFGCSIAVSGDVLVVGARQDGEHGVNSGAAYVYRYSGSAWQLESKLTASDAGMGESFGSDLGVEGDTIIVGVPASDSFGPNRGAAYVFEFDGTQWNETACLHADSLGAHPQDYGASVAIENQIIVVGEPGYSEQMYSPIGAVHVYTRLPSDQWTQAQLLTGVADQYEKLGADLAMKDGRLITTSNGSVQIYQLINGVFNHEASLPKFARSVTISGPYALLGDEFNNDRSPNSGIVYEYAFDGSAWYFSNVFRSQATAPYDHFGASLAIDGDEFYMGAPGDGESGAIYMDHEPEPCPTDLYRNCVLDYLDVSIFIQGYLNQEPVADFTGDGQFNFMDVSAFLTAYLAGCP